MSFPAVELKPTLDTNAASSTELRCSVDVPRKAPPGVGAFRLVTTNGITALRLFMLDDLPTVDESATNKTIAAAQPVKWPTAVDGHADEITFDYFKFNAKQGEQVSIEVVAQRLGSSLDPVLRLLDENGREIAYCDDDARVGRDSRLRCKIASTGAYLVEVRDINYGGGPAFFYRLRIGDFPLTAMSYPPFQKAETNAAVKILSDHGKSLPNAKAEIPSGVRRVSVPVRTRRDGGASFVSLLAAEFPQVVEKEPNNGTNTATSLTIPCGVSGRFEQPMDVDVFRFTASKDQRLLFRARNRSVGSPCDLFMSIQDTKGATVAEYDPTAPDEGTITNTFKADGEFFLVIEELNQSGGPDLGYHIEISELRPGFALSLEASEFQGRAGETVTAKVTAVRRDYDGPIQLAVESPCPITTESATIAEKKNETDLKIRLPDDLAPGVWFPVTITGEAKIRDREESVVASTLPALRKLWPTLRYPPVELDGLVAIGVRSSESKDAEGRPRRRRNE